MENKEYYTIKELKELGVPQSTINHWLYVSKRAKKIEIQKTIEEFVVPKEIVERWQYTRHDKKI